ncbi:hypothetical protein COCMIDRAFT_82162 [Bipolaris oryzae ATCC 44560]|uniref:Kinesin motor domain-containing protein n=1 Tax=Bipolaris oryzae ATCC 44560 TaxID=930090 RepID=W6ZES0_COCMI|nr:uncharacterized protein COCMIDRAFT_82162 [Bipolaris oryzae ATCC 44560]EUC50322.1 hypothetical protein COCMIDRAFT_82162 [Bipolaris oryzae ATCC 44560]
MIGSVVRSSRYAFQKVSPIRRLSWTRSSHVRRLATAAASRDGSDLPLAGIKILDMTRVLAGPYCTQILGDLGADVIKIEHPTRGDDTRAWGPPYAKYTDEQEGPGESAYYLGANRNKRSIGLSFQHPAGVGILHRLVKECDVLVENYLPGSLAKYAMDYDTVSKINPDIIYASITGYGQTGPYRNRAGYDVMVEAEMGLMHITGTRDGPPVKVGVAVTDLTTGLYTSNSIIAALFRRFRSPGSGGQHIDVALSDCQVATLANIASSCLISGQRDSGRWGTSHPSIVPYKAFKTADGDILLGGGNDKLYGIMCNKLGKPEWITDEKFKTNALRVQHRDELEELIEAETRKKSTQELLDVFEGSGMPYAAINDVQDTLNHEHVLARNMVKEIKHPACGPIKLVNTPVKWSQSTPGIRLPPPLLGQHTDEILSDTLGMSKEDVEALRSEGVVAYSLFNVFLRLRPSNATNARFLTVEESDQGHPTHITIQPPTNTNDKRKRAVERFAFTQVFEEDAQQMHLFKGTGIVQMIEGVMGAPGHHGRDGLFATLGCSGSGKSHTILGTKTQRGLVQMTLDTVYQACDGQLVQSFYGAPAFSSLAAADVSDSQMYTATAYLDTVYGDNQSERFPSRAQTPMQDCSIFSTGSNWKSNKIPRPSLLPQTPSVDDIHLPEDPTVEYAIIMSMYEVYNDRIFDLLSGSASKNKNHSMKRRALLFKNTEQSPDRKVVAGLTKIICGSYEEAMMILETGLMERKVTGTGSNAVSSRSHGFFNIEIKKRNAENKGPWSSSNLTIVDLAGSERARNAKTAGETLAEAGKINESLMYLGQCMQMQSDNAGGSKNIVPFRQCKLTELLFSNSYPSSSRTAQQHRSPQKSIMVVTADPKSDYNATSQILRYSALAREVTVPRIPSTTETILASLPQKRPGTSSSARTASSGRASPAAIMEELEHANAEVARLTAELEVFALRLSEETARRKAAESSWAAAEDHLVDFEQEIRDECYHEMEAAVDQERRRWQTALENEQDNQQAHMDSKIDVVIRATKASMKQDIKVYEDPDPELRDRVEELERENEMLRAKLEANERETQQRSASPIKRMRVLKAKKWADPSAYAMDDE